MSMTFGPYPEAEIAYRRERIIADYHQKEHVGRRRFPWRRHRRQ